MVAYHDFRRLQLIFNSTVFSRIPKFRLGLGLNSFLLSLPPSRKSPLKISFNKHITLRLLTYN